MSSSRVPRRILLTGTTGFIGSHLARLLVREGQTVFAVIRPGSNRWRVHDLLDKLTVLEFDLTDTEALSEQLRIVQPEMCIHLAWRGWSDGAAAADANISSLSVSLNLMRLIGNAGCRRFIATGTCLEYDMTTQPLSERTPLRSNNLYGTCKSALLRAAEQYSLLCGLRVAWPRIFYFYGSHEDERRLVPSVVLSLLQGELAKTTAGEQVRDYLHVEDIASALWAVAQSDLTGPINVASGTTVTVRDLIQRIAQIVDRTELLRLGALPYRQDEPMVIRTDATLLRRGLGWSPHYDLDRGLRQTIDWWKTRLPSPVRSAS